MPSFAANFLNVRTEDDFFPATDDDFTDRLGEMIRATVVRDRGTGMTQPLPPERTLWFPPGEYRIRADFAFPPTVTLSFAAGAVIVPVRTTVSGVVRELVTIAGPVEAPLTRIFANEVGAPAGVPVGRVAFVGEGTTRVYPEWWGAARTPGSPNATEDTAAIRSAIWAATIDREALTSTNPRPAVAITFVGSYHVNDTIAVAPSSPSGLLRTLLLEGASIRDTGATISPSPDLAGGSIASGGSIFSVFSIERVAQVLIRRLTIRSNGRALHGLVVMIFLLRFPTAHQIVLDRCVFAGARADQVTILEASPFPAAGGALSVQVRSCHFSALDSTHTDYNVNLRPTAVGLYLLAAFGADLSMDHSSFEGYFDRAVHTIGGARSRITGCAFRLYSSPRELLPNGAAIVLERLGIFYAKPPSLDAFGCDVSAPCRCG